MKPIRLAAAPKILVKRDANDDQLQTLAAMFEWPGHVADTSTVRRKNPLNENEQKQFVSGDNSILQRAPDATARMAEASHGSLQR